MRQPGTLATRSAAGLVVLTLLFRATGAGAERAPHLRFTTYTELPGIGLRLRLMPDARAIPIPAPAAYPYSIVKRTPGGVVSERIDMYDPREIWRHEQHGALWSDEFGNTLVIATVIRPFPGAPPDRIHTSPEEYEQSLASSPAFGATVSDAQLSQWAAAFVGATKAEAEPVKRPPGNLSAILRFTLNGVEAGRLAFAFQVKGRKIGGRHTPGNTWIFALFQINAGTDIGDAMEAIDGKFFPSITAIGTQTGIRQPTAAPAQDRSTQYAVSRKRVADSIKNLEDWWLEETPHYIILSNQQKMRRVTTRYLRTNMEIMRDAYAQLVPTGADMASVSVIRIFSTSSEYETFVGPAYAWTGGLWMSVRNELVIRPIDEGADNQQRDRILSVAYHEGFHQYLSCALDQLQVSPWFNEGHAAFFEVADLRGSRVQIPENEPLAKDIQATAESGKLDIRPILFMNNEQFYAGSDDDRRHNYALAWGMIYYMRKGAEILREPGYAAIPGKYYEALTNTRDPAAATKAAFNGIDMTALNGVLTDFWKSRNRRRTARANHIIKPAVTVRN